MTIQERIEQYKLACEISPGFGLEQIDAAMAATGGMAMQAALSMLRSEVQAVVDEQDLAEWLEENGIPEWQWADYTCSNGIISYLETVVNG